MVTHPKQFNLSAYAFGTNLEGGDLVQRTKIKKLVIFFINLYEVLGSAHDQCGILDMTQPMTNQK